MGPCPRWKVPFEIHRDPDLPQNFRQNHSAMLAPYSVAPRPL